MTNQPTTARTKERAEILSRFLFEKITWHCAEYIKEGEQATRDWIKRICDKYHVIV